MKPYIFHHEGRYGNTMQQEGEVKEEMEPDPFDAKTSTTSECRKERGKTLLHKTLNRKNLRSREGKRQES